VETLGLLGLLLLVLYKCRAPSSPGSPHWPSSQPSQPPALPPGTTTSLPPAATAPWPQVVPSGLPPFPGSGWVYDEPPPLEVQQRAQQLVSPLWAQGSGAFKVEQTAGRWIAYRAEMVKARPANKKGIVAYRLRATAAAPKAPSAAPSVPRRPVPAVPVPPSWNVLTSVHPGTATQSTPSAQSTPGAPMSAPAELALPVLRYGIGLRPQAPNPDVRVLQQRLHIADDGQFGPGTRSAVLAFQGNHGLTADGIVGPKTWAALFASGG
jgi:hypothetical protein